MANQDPSYLSRESVGDQLYFWRSATGGHRCLISAHGGYHLFSGTFRPSSISPRIQINFYAPHGQLLSDPGLNVLQDDYQHMISYNPEITNYRLTKFQTKHGEKYSDIQNNIDKQRNNDIALNDLMHILNEPTTPNSLKPTLRATAVLQSQTLRHHIVTIRHRQNFTNSFNIGITLEEIVKQIYQYANITEFYCSFCRSNVLNPFAKSYTPRKSAPYRGGT